MNDEKHREPAPSFEDISEKIDIIDRKVDRVLENRSDSDPPQLKWIDHRLGAALRKASKAVLLGALTALGAGAAGWAMRDCQVKLERAGGADAGAHR